MTVSLTKMLEMKRATDATLTDAKLQKQLDILSAATGPKGPVIPGVHPREIVFDNDEDPFGGNINNRNVAERIAQQSRRVYHNSSRPIHMGDPEKARADIAKSKALVPDPVEEGEEADDLPKPTMTPTPGSPAAAKSASTPAAPAASPAWQPGK